MGPKLDWRKLLTNKAATQSADITQILSVADFHVADAKWLLDGIRRRLSVAFGEQCYTIFGMPSKHFHTTNWSVVLRAGRADEADAQAALETLCQRYWYPLYVFVRRTGMDHDRAEDLTQGFFARLIEKSAIVHAAPSRGRFRSFLLASFQNFLANERDQAGAKKRGGGKAMFSLDADVGNSKLLFESAHDLTPEKIFDRAWTLRLLQLVMGKLRLEFIAKGKSAEFDLLQSFLTGRNEASSYEQPAAALGMSEAAVRQSVHRMRGRYRELLRAEIADTVADANEIDDEIRSLFASLAN